MTTLMTSTYGGIEVSLVRYPDRYKVAVTDDEGLLHLTEFRFGHFTEGTEEQGDQDQACEQALEWFDNVEACVSHYVRNPTSQSIKSLVSTLN